MRLENLSREDAHQAALRVFGNPGLIETRGREVWRWPMLDSMLSDMKLAFRRLRQSPGFAITRASNSCDRHRLQHGRIQGCQRRASEAASLPGQQSAGFFRWMPLAQRALQTSRRACRSPPQCILRSARTIGHFSRWEHGDLRRQTSAHGPKR